MKFDIIFLDQTAPKAYDRTTLEQHGLGGTEASVIRVAEGLGALGLTVAVIQTKNEPFETIYGQNCFYMHAENIPANIECDHFVQIRGIAALGLFPKAKQYAWLHDLSDENMRSWLVKLRKYDVTLIGVSKWHKKDIEKYSDYHKVEYIYNPVPDEIYVKPGFKPQYDKNNMIWLSSPHKGLQQAIDIFKKIKQSAPLMNLLVFNPGYFPVNKEYIFSVPGIQFVGAMPARAVWPVLQKSMCVFYPGTIEETFGCIAAEANAVGTPVLCYDKGALPEVCSSKDQLIEDNNESKFIETILKWNSGERPVVYGNTEFRFTRVIKEWVRLLDI